MFERGRDNYMLTYKGYIAKVDIDLEEGILSGGEVNIRDVITFSGRYSCSTSRRNSKFSVDDYLIAFCKEKGSEPEKPCSGKISLRVSPELHRAAVSAAILEGISLNAWLSKTIEKAAIS